MAEPDIVERLRDAVDVMSTVYPGSTSSLMLQAAAEIERLRGGGWTQLGAGSLPPQTGEVFEMSFGAGRERCVLAWNALERSYDGSELASGGWVVAVSYEEGQLAAFVGWWRLLPGGEGPT